MTNYCKHCGSTRIHISSKGGYARYICLTCGAETSLLDRQEPTLNVARFRHGWPRPKDSRKREIAL